MTLEAAPHLPRHGHSWSSHFKDTLWLGIPLIGAQLAQLGIHVTDIVVVGRLGTTQLAAMVLAAQYFFTLFIFGSGFATAVIPMAAQSAAQNDPIMVRRAVRMGLWAVIIYSAAVMPAFWYSDQVWTWLGQDPAVIELATRYVRIAGWAMVPGLGFMVLRSFLSAVDKANFILVATVVVLVVNAFFAYTLVLGHFGMPALGITGAAIVALIANTLGLIITMIYIEWDVDLRSYKLFERFWRPDWQILREVAILGLPIGLSILAEVSLFTAASILMGWIGTIELAAHGIALQWASIAFMIPLGLAQAATVRIGHAAGRGDRAMLVRASWVIIYLSAGLAIAGGLIFAAIPSELAALYLDPANPDSAAVLAYATGLVVIAGIFQLVDGLQAVAQGLLRGLKDTRVPMVMAMVAYWPIGFLLAWFLAFPMGMGGTGVWIGFLAGLAAAAVMLLWRYVVLVRALRMG